MNNVPLRVRRVARWIHGEVAAGPRDIGELVHLALSDGISPDDVRAGAAVLGLTETDGTWALPEVPLPPTVELQARIEAFRARFSPNPAVCAPGAGAEFLAQLEHRAGGAS